MGTFYLFKHPFLTTKSTFFLRNKDKEHHAEQESADDTKSELVHSVMEQQVLEVHLQITMRIIRFWNRTSAEKPLRKRYSSCLELPLFYLGWMEGHSDFSRLTLKFIRKGHLNSIHLSQPCLDGETNSAASQNTEISSWCSYSPSSVGTGLTVNKKSKHKRRKKPFLSSATFTLLFTSNLLFFFLQQIKCYIIQLFWDIDVSSRVWERETICIQILGLFKEGRKNVRT